MSNKLSVKIQDGIVLIVVGIFFLLQSMNIIQWDIVWYAIRMWPLILILVGINMVFNKPWVKYAGIGIYIVCTIAFYLFTEAGYGIEFMM